MKLLFGLLFLAVSTIHAESFPPKGFTEIRKEWSPGETFEVIYFRKDPDDTMSDAQIWIRDSTPPQYKAQLLFEYSNDARCLVSDDDKFIAVNNHIMSGLGDMEIFVRKEDGYFQRRKTDILNISLKVMAKQLGLKKVRDISDLDHIACVADAWTRNGILRCELDGNQGHRYFEWYFTYDAKKNEFLWNSKINRR